MRAFVAPLIRPTQLHTLDGLEGARRDIGQAAGEAQDLGRRRSNAGHGESPELLPIDLNAGALPGNRVSNHVAVLGI